MRNGVKVPARRKDDIKGLANFLRSHLQLSCVYVKIENVYEVLADILDFNFEIVSKSELGDDHGRTHPDKNLIKIREDVYNAACNGSGRDRFTMAHELGHLFLHRDIQFSRATVPHEIYEDSEWQADVFASAFLIAEEHLHKCRNVQEVSNTFGVTPAAAKCRFGK